MPTPVIAPTTAAPTTAEPTQHPSPAPSKHPETPHPTPSHTVKPTYHKPTSHPSPAPSKHPETPHPSPYHTDKPTYHPTHPHSSPTPSPHNSCPSPSDRADFAAKITHRLTAEKWRVCDWYNTYTVWNKEGEVGEEFYQLGIASPDIATTYFDFKQVSESEDEIGLWMRGVDRLASFYIVPR